jgi:hypothetical protein
MFVKEAKNMKKENHREHYKTHPKIHLPSLGTAIKLLPNNLKRFILISALF